MHIDYTFSPRSPLRQTCSRVGVYMRWFCWGRRWWSECRQLASILERQGLWMHSFGAKPCCDTRGTFSPYLSPASLAECQSQWRGCHFSHWWFAVGPSHHSSCKGHGLETIGLDIGGNICQVFKCSWAPASRACPCTWIYHALTGWQSRRQQWAGREKECHRQAKDPDD